MTKKIMTEEELTRMIQERVSSSKELDGDCKEVIVNSVYWHELDENGSNWDVHSLRNGSGCEEVVNTIVEDFKKKYNLEDR